VKRYTRTFGVCLSAPTQFDGNAVKQIGNGDAVP
jgi:hypothetical protein